MKKKLKVAVLFDEKLSNGGGYVQSINAALLTKGIKSEKIEFIYISTYKENLSLLKNLNLTPCFYFKEDFLSRLKTITLRIYRGTRVHQIIEKLNIFSSFENFLKKNEVDLVYFLSLSKKGLDLSLINFIVTIWDISHLDEPEFPEIREQSIASIRDKIIEPILKRSSAVIVDSNTSKKNISNRFHLNPEKLKVIHFEASNTIQNFHQNNFSNEMQQKILDKYLITNPYIYYPAQFWAHKNHSYILYAIKDLQERFDTKINVVFSGSDKGNLKYILDLAKELKISKSVNYLGFVESNEMPILYKNSIALVMPSYFGPTNIPPLEALTLSIPIIYADINGAREQLGNAAIFVNLSKPEELALAIYNLKNDADLKSNLIKNGAQLLKNMMTKEDRINILETIINKFFYKRLTWK
tara:strand:- start:38504 stop:39739 length:1236 start_codon:yes stop_codon:yes gene_type:complete